jgi:hypothetical protein
MAASLGPPQAAKASAEAQKRKVLSVMIVCSLVLSAKIGVISKKMLIS